MADLHQWAENKSHTREQKGNVCGEGVGRGGEGGAAKAGRQAGREERRGKGGGETAQHSSTQHGKHSKAKQSTAHHSSAQQSTTANIYVRRKHSHNRPRRVRLMCHIVRPSPTVDAVSANGRCRDGCFGLYTARAQLHPVEAMRTCARARYSDT